MTFIVFTGNPPERGATTPSALGSPRGGDISSSVGGMLPPPSSPVSRGDQLHKRIESLVQQVDIYCYKTFDTLVNNVLRHDNIELDLQNYLHFIEPSFEVRIGDIQVQGQELARRK